MVRPRKTDRDSVAMTHVRISSATKRLIDELRLKHGFKTTDAVLKRYLSSSTAHAPASTEDRQLTKEDIIRATHENKGIDRIIRGLAAKYKS
jgi:hypothetical protein